MSIQVPIGIDDFRRLGELGLEYVDKSHLIQELVDRPGTEVVLLPRPRRFGKTLNLSSGMTTRPSCGRRARRRSTRWRRRSTGRWCGRREGHRRVRRRGGAHVLSAQPGPGTRGSLHFFPSQVWIRNSTPLYSITASVSLP
ncbi:AAA family ATPase [Sorangium sp. So ce327]|uniref:AAA family ATPase n=1 Tax=Sorangium sp. So ce327 TaxID=3133301 RepID=UPI003F646072